MSTVPAHDPRCPEWCVAHDPDPAAPVLHFSDWPGGRPHEDRPYLYLDDSSGDGPRVCIFGEQLTPEKALALAEQLRACGTEAMTDPRGSDQ
jgi:hypothetical protein